jgi:hypothetical protein
MKHRDLNHVSTIASPVGDNFSVESVVARLVWHTVKVRPVILLQSNISSYVFRQQRDLWVSGIRLALANIVCLTLGWV